MSVAGDGIIRGAVGLKPAEAIRSPEPGPLRSKAEVA